MWTCAFFLASTKVDDAQISDCKTLVIRVRRECKDAEKQTLVSLQAPGDVVVLVDHENVVLTRWESMKRRQ